MANAKLKELRKLTGGVNISEMFEEMMGLKDADIAIITPKIISSHHSVRAICRILEQFVDIMSKGFPTHKEEFDEISAFVVAVRENLKIQDSDIDESNVQTDQVAANARYKEFKSATYCKKLIIQCAKLKPYSHNFANLDKMRENFVNSDVGKSTLFTFSSIDFKLLWVNDAMKPAAKKYVMTVFHKLYKELHALYLCVTSPDVDIEAFTSILITSLAELKKHPKLSRCVNAFKRIEQSVQLLREKFSSYYRDSIASENPDMLIMNFVIDVSNQGGANLSLTREFKIIIQYMQEAAKQSGKSNNPEVKKMFDLMNSNFSAMEKEVSNNPE